MQNFQFIGENQGKNPNDILWGEIDQRRFGDASLLPNEDLHLKFTQVTLEGPTIFQPTPGQDVALACQKDTLILNEYVIAGLRLLDFKTDVDALQENLLTGAVAGEIPRLPPLVQPKRYTQISGTDNEPVPLSASLTRNLMQNAVAAITAFSGYDQSTDEALDILTDVGCKFMKNFCKLLRVSRDNQLLGNSSGFSDVMERTYRDVGLGSVLDIREFYREKIVGRYQSLRNDCETIWENCQILARASDGVFTGTSIDIGDQFSTMDSDQFMTIGSDHYTGIDETFSTIDNIPEIHFPSSEDGTYTFDHNTPQMEHGMQMLQSLEQGTYAAMEDQGSPTSRNPKMSR